MRNADPSKTYKQVSAGRDAFLLLSTDGSVGAIDRDGYTQFEETEPETGVIYFQVSIGFDHYVLLRSDGRVLARGSNVLGDATYDSQELA